MDAPEPSKGHDHQAGGDQLGQDLRRAAPGPADAGSPAQGMVLTLIIVCDEAEYEDALRGQHGGRPGAPVPHPAGGHRHAAGQPSLDAEVRIGEGTPGEVVVIRMRGAVAAHPASVIRPLLLPDSPVVIWWPGKMPAPPGRRRTRPAHPPPADRCGRGHPAAGRAEGAGQGLLPRRHRPELDPADPVARPAGGRAGPVPGQDHGPRWSRPSGATRPPSCSPPGCSRSCNVADHPQDQQRARHHRGPDGHRGRRHRHHPAGRPARLVRRARAARAAGRPEAARAHRADLRRAPPDGCRRGLRADARALSAARPPRRLRQEGDRGEEVATTTAEAPREEPTS